MATRKPRKWSNLKGVIPDADSGVITPWMKKVLAAKDTRAEHSMATLADEYAGLKAADKKAEEDSSKRKVLYKALELRVLEELKKVKEVAGMDTWQGAAGQSFSPKFTPRPVVKDPEALMAWIHETKQTEQLTLPGARLKAIVCEALDTKVAAVLTPAQREQLKPGDPASGAPPPGVDVFLQTSVSWTGGKRSANADPSEALADESSTGPEEGPF